MQLFGEDRRRNLARALTILNGTRLPYLGIYVNAAGYGYREVEL
ncbi:MAG: hypothetical protein ACLR53_02280 [Evtepia gabavorous]